MAEGTELSYPKISCYELLARSCVEHGPLCAIEYYKKKISYDRLIKLIDEAAASLVALNVKRGDHIAIILPNVPEAAVLFYAANRAGAVADMIHPLSAEHELEFYIKHSEIRYVFAIDAVTAKLTPLRNSVDKIISVNPSDFMGIGGKIVYKDKTVKNDLTISFKAFMKLGRDIDLDKVPMPSSDDVCALLYTGGTTGDPKGVMLTSYNFNCCAIEAIQSCGCIEPEDRLLTVLPVFHGFGLGVCVHTVLIAGAVTDMVPVFNVKYFAELVKKHKPDIIAAVPAMYGCLVDGWNRNDSLANIKCAISGGDMLPPRIQHSVNELFSQCGRGNKIRQGYGLAECLSGICLSPEGIDYENCIGLPYKDNKITIVSHETCEELPAGQIGEIVVSGPVVMRGYYNDPNASKEVLINNEDGSVSLRTGDMGYKNEEGFVFFKGRFKNIIVSNGYDIYPSVIEDVISGVAKVRECAVVGIEDDKRGQIARAYVVTDDDSDKELVLRDICSSLKANVAAYAIPKDIRFTGSLPRTKIGKIDKKALAEY